MESRLHLRDFSMPRFWLIAPFHADIPELWEKIWAFDLKQGVMSIGWRELPNISSLEYDELSELVGRTYPNYRPATRTLVCRMLHNFYHEIKPGDVIIARQGRKIIAAIGTVKRAAYYKHKMNQEAAGTEWAYSNHIDVDWAPSPRDLEFVSIEFPIQTIYEISQERYRELTNTRRGGAKLQNQETTAGAPYRMANPTNATSPTGNSASVSAPKFRTTTLPNGLTLLESWHADGKRTKQTYGPPGSTKLVEVQCRKLLELGYERIV
jgi:hypothetical protein